MLELLGPYSVEKINSVRFFEIILTEFFLHLTRGTIIHFSAGFGNCMQSRQLYDIFGRVFFYDKITSYGLWPACLPEITP
jgi:hypothetical protein